MKRGRPIQRKTPLKSESPLKRTAAWPAPATARSTLHANSAAHRQKPKRQRDTGPSDKVVAQVAQRDEWSCVRCGGSCHGRRGLDWSVQHRRARGMGGSRRPDTNEPHNLILLCGSATSPGGCHLRVESRLPEDDGMGWSIKQSQNPLLEPVLHWQRGLIFLDADGGWSSRPSTTAEEAS